MRRFVGLCLVGLVIGCAGPQRASVAVEPEVARNVPESARRFVARFLDTLAAHDVAGALPYFDVENRTAQRELGIGDAQFVAEGVGLHTVERLDDTGLPNPVPWDGAAELRAIGHIELERLAIDPDFPTGVTASGRIEMRDGRVFALRLFLVRRDVPLGWQIAPPLG